MNGIISILFNVHPSNKVSFPKYNSFIDKMIQSNANDAIDPLLVRVLKCNKNRKIGNENEFANFVLLLHQYWRFFLLCLQ